MADDQVLGGQRDAAVRRGGQEQIRWARRRKGGGFVGGAERRCCATDLSPLKLVGLYKLTADREGRGRSRSMGRSASAFATRTVMRGRRDRRLPLEDLGS